MTKTACSRSAGILGLAATLLMTGCVMPDQVSQMQKDMADVQLQLRRVEREQSEASERLQATEQTDKAEAPISRAELADLTLNLEQAMRQMAIADERISDLSRRLDRYSQDVQQARSSARNGPPSGTGYFPNDDPVLPSDGGIAPSQPARTNDAAPDPEALYNTAYADFSKGNFSLAVSGFEEYQERFSESALADNALYWVGECHFSQGNYPTAIRSFDRLLNLYPKSDKSAAGNLKKALAFMEQNKIGEAIIQLRYVASAYGGSDEARIAQEKLTHLGAAP